MSPYIYYYITALGVLVKKKWFVDAHIKRCSFLVKHREFVWQVIFDANHMDVYWKGDGKSWRSGVVCLGKRWEGNFVVFSVFNAYFLWTNRGKKQH